MSSSLSKIDIWGDDGSISATKPTILIFLKVNSTWTAITVRRPHFLTFSDDELCFSRLAAAPQGNSIAMQVDTIELHGLVSAGEFSSVFLAQQNHAVPFTS